MLKNKRRRSHGGASECAAGNTSSLASVGSLYGETTSRTQPGSGSPCTRASQSGWIYRTTNTWHATRNGHTRQTTCNTHLVGEQPVRCSAVRRHARGLVVVLASENRDLVGPVLVFIRSEDRFLDLRQRRAVPDAHEAAERLVVDAAVRLRRLRNPPSRMPCRSRGHQSVYTYGLFLKRPTART